MRSFDYYFSKNLRNLLKLSIYVIAVPFNRELQQPEHEKQALLLINLCIVFLDIIDSSYHWLGISFSDSFDDILYWSDGSRVVRCYHCYY